VDPAAVVLDLDGVLIDSEQLWDDVRRGQAAEADRPWPAEATSDMQGMSTPEWSAYLVERVGVPGPPGRVAAEVVARMADRYRQGVPLLPGADGAVRGLADRWPLAVASSSPPALIREVLDRAGFLDRFQVLVSSEEVDSGKPFPDVYLAAAARLHVPPRHCLAVEDSANGLRAGAAAGMTVIAVPNPHYPPPEDALALAAAVVDAAGDLTPELVESLPEPPAD
jgi:HAD superfamily hydrolase (TIGR01509 family)